MSYFGVKIKRGSYEITAKIHGPLDSFEIEPLKFKEFIKKFLQDFMHNKVTFNQIDAANDLALAIRNDFCNGVTMVWTEVEIASVTTGFLFSASAERIVEYDDSRF